MIKGLTSKTRFTIFGFSGLIFITIIIFSCDTGFNSTGTVIDKYTRSPIDSVSINIKNLDSIYTDSIGKYIIDTMIYGFAGDLEILLSKKGYKTKYVNFKTDKIKKENAIIEMEKLTKSSQDFCISKKLFSYMYYFNKYLISLINILTLIFLIVKKSIKFKIVWIVGVILINFTIFISFIDGRIVDFKLINGPIYIIQYWISPFSLKIVIPVFSILFWIIYLINKKKLLKNKL